MKLTVTDRAVKSAGAFAVPLRVPSFRAHGARRPGAAHGEGHVPVSGVAFLDAGIADRERAARVREADCLARVEPPPRRSRRGEIRLRVPGPEQRLAKLRNRQPWDPGEEERRGTRNVWTRHRGAGEVVEVARVVVTRAAVDCDVIEVGAIARVVVVVALHVELDLDPRLSFEAREVIRPGIGIRAARAAVPVVDRAAPSRRPTLAADVNVRGFKSVKQVGAAVSIGFPLMVIGVLALAVFVISWVGTATALWIIASVVLGLGVVSARLGPVV